MWLRGGLLAYLAGAFSPAGRVVGEAARASALAPSIGGARAVAGAARAHGVFLVANAAVSVLCFAAVARASGSRAPLALLVGWNAVLNGALGALLVSAARLRLAQVAGRVSSRLAARLAALEASARALPRAIGAAIALALLGRALHVLQAGVVLHALGGAFCAAWLGEAIQIAAANLGDAVPAQAGVLEAAARTFAPDLGLVASTADALALLLRAPRLALAALAGVVRAASRRAMEHEHAA